MKTPTSRRLILIAQVLLLLLVASCEACKKKPPAPDPEPEPVRARLSVASVTPSSMEEAAATDVTIEGEEFHHGASVDFGGYRAGDVVVVDGGTIRATVPGSLPAGSHDVRVTNSDGSSALLRGGFTVRPRQQAECTLDRIYFGYDKSDLDDASRSAISAAARCIQQRGYSRVVIEGHADERGETDYNLALGQRRADSVKRYLIDLGVSASVLTTLSYGEEKPIDTRSGEDAWSRNRRAELVPGR
ncbi:OmpA family protein [Myxococcota bacterium]|nr:OmpA family protein [Myxococcota bacterium]